MQRLAGDVADFVIDRADTPSDALTAMTAVVSAVCWATGVDVEEVVRVLRRVQDAMPREVC